METNERHDGHGLRITNPEAHLCKADAFDLTWEAQSEPQKCVDWSAVEPLVAWKLFSSLLIQLY
jgi:hypothetical protein